MLNPARCGFPHRIDHASLPFFDAGHNGAHLAARGLSKYDMPEYFIALNALPLTASGKILKRELVEQVRRGDIVPRPVRWQAS